ncbi:hypothetical protein SARC_16188, partial [Sphaeroforma arctica JP610]
AVSASYTMLSLRTTINELEEYRCFYKGDKVAYRAPDSSHLTDPSTARGAACGFVRPKCIATLQAGYVTCDVHFHL